MVGAKTNEAKLKIVGGDIFTERVVHGQRGVGVGPIPCCMYGFAAVIITTAQALHLSLCISSKLSSISATLLLSSPLSLPSLWNSGPNCPLEELQSLMRMRVPLSWDLSHHVTNLSFNSQQLYWVTQHCWASLICLYYTIFIFPTNFWCAQFVCLP